MINKLFKHRYFLITLQLIILFVFILLVYLGIGITTNDPDFAKILRNTNLPNLIVWSYWWPLIIATAILFGRYWCTICPMELITSFFGRIGLKKSPGKFLKSGWVITLFYAIIVVLGIHTFAIHRIPMYMAIYMLSLFVVAVVVGLIWEKRTFCTYVCPIGHLLGLYSLLSFKKLGVKDGDICKTCTTKDCISKNNHYKFIGRSCTSELYPPKILDNRNCILCGQCFKSCSKNNIAIKKRRLAADLFTNIELKWSEMAFFLIVSGFVVYEILSEWSVTKKIVIAIPKWLNQTLELSGGISNAVKAITLFVVLPFIFYSILVLAKKVFAKESWKRGSIQLALSILPIVGSMHLLKSFFKMTSRIPYWRFVFLDPKGVDTATSIMQNPELLQNSFLTDFISPIVSVVSILLPIIGLVLSFFVIKGQIHKNRVSKLISVIAVVVYSSLFIITIINWKII